jgi:hypothetical protein
MGLVAMFIWHVFGVDCTTFYERPTNLHTSPTRLAPSYHLYSKPPCRRASPSNESLPLCSQRGGDKLAFLDIHIDTTVAAINNKLNQNG